MRERASSTIFENYGGEPETDVKKRETSHQKHAKSINIILNKRFPKITTAEMATKLVKACDYKPKWVEHSIPNDIDGLADMNGRGRQTVTSMIKGRVILAGAYSTGGLH
jgi:hypothetical protein